VPADGSLPRAPKRKENGKPIVDRELSASSSRLA
jgi:hypothetical protein